MYIQELIDRLTTIREQCPNAVVGVDEGADGPDFSIVDVVVNSSATVLLEIGDGINGVARCKDCGPGIGGHTFTDGCAYAEQRRVGLPGQRLITSDEAPTCKRCLGAGCGWCNHKGVVDDE